ncbi:MAG: hypothetical protein WC626_04195, partial [Methanoregula sp.]
MNLPSVMNEIRNNPSLAPYRRDVHLFLEYLHTTAKISFVIHGEQYCDDAPPDIISKKVEYIHRWTSIYRKSILKKFYQLENWL